MNYTINTAVVNVILINFVITSPNGSIIYINSSRSRRCVHINEIKTVLNLAFFSMAILLKCRLKYILVWQI